MPAVNNASLYGRTSSGGWEPWDTVWAKNNGVWKFGMVVWVKDDDEWKQVFVRLTSATNLTSSFSSGNKTVTLNWTPGLGADGFRVYNGPLMIKEVTGGTTSTTTVELDYYISHSITVRSYSGDIEADPTNTVIVYNTITAPSSLTITGGSGTRAVSLSWTAGSGQTTYYIYRGGVKIDETTSTTYATTLPDYYTNYEYSVRGFYANNTSGATSATKQASMSTPSITNRSIGAWTYSYTTVDGTPRINEWDESIPSYTLTWSSVDGASTYEVVRSDGAVGYTTTNTSFTFGVGTDRNVERAWKVRAKHITGNVGTYSSNGRFYIGQPQVRETRETVKFHDTVNRTTTENRAALSNPVNISKPVNTRLIDFRAELWCSFQTGSVDNGTSRLAYVNRPDDYGGDRRITFFTNTYTGPIGAYDFTITPSLNAGNNFGYSGGNWGIYVEGDSWSTKDGDFYIGKNKNTSSALGRLFIRLRYREVSQTEVANSLP
jgi:hypothetical protein